MSINKFFIFAFLSFSIIAQENEEVPIEDVRDNKIKSLIEIVKKNRDVYVSEDKARLNKFLNLVDEREKMLSKAKLQLENEQKRNKRLEDSFQQNEKILAELEDSLQIKIGVLGELFGVTRQFAGELLASSEKEVTFFEYSSRPEVLKSVGSKKVHNLDDLNHYG